MPDVQHQGVHKHECSVEHVEWPFVLLKISSVALENVDDTKYMAAGNNDAANVHEIQDATDPVGILRRVSRVFGVEGPRVDAATVENVFEKNKEKESNELQEDGGAEKSLSRVDVGRGRIYVGDTCAAVASEDAHNDVKAAEGGNDATRMDRAELRDVVEDAAKDYVVQQGVDGWSHKDKDRARNEEV